MAATAPNSQVLMKSLMILAIIFQHDSSDHFSANEWSTSKKMAHPVMSGVHMAPEEVFEQGHIVDKKKSIHWTNSNLA